MQEKSRHIIQKSRVIIDAPDGTKVEFFQAGISNAFEKRIPELLDSVCSSLFPSSEIVKIDRLELSLGDFSEENFEAEFVDRFIKTLQSKLADFKLDDPSVQVVSKEEEASNVLLQYILEGKVSDSTFTEAAVVPTKLFENLSVSQQEEFVVRLIPFLSRESVAKRIAYQFSPNVWQALFKQTSGQSLVESLAREAQVLSQVFELLLPVGITAIQQETIAALLMAFDAQKGRINRSSWVQRLLQLLMHRKGFSLIQVQQEFVRRTNLKAELVKVIHSNSAQNSELTDAVEALIKTLDPTNLGNAKSNHGESDSDLDAQDQPTDPSNQKQIDVSQSEGSKHSVSSEEKEELLFPLKKSPFEQSPFDSEDKTEAVFVNNAGLILLAPFLTSFFEYQKLMEKGEFLHPEAAWAGVNLLVALGGFEEDRIAEPSWWLNKVLCGLDPNEPVPIIEPKPEQLEACEELLTAVIGHWKALKNMSVSGFKEAFIQRQGKLVKEASGDWRLHVEKRGYDVLMESLPWSISVIKMKCMSQMIHVVW